MQGFKMPENDEFIQGSTLFIVDVSLVDMCSNLLPEIFSSNF